jgi:cytochrome c oxidase subunit I+III
MDSAPAGRLALSLARGEGYLGFARNGWQETLGVHMTSGAPEQVIILPRPTYLPLCTALATAAAVLTMLAGWYTLSLAAALLTAGLFVRAGQSAGLERDYGPLPVGHGLSVPPHTEVADPPPWWSLIFTLVADGTLFASLVFGTFYLWIAAPKWPAAVEPEPRLGLAALVIVALLVAAAAARGSMRALANGKPIFGWVALAIAALVIAMAGDARLIGGVVPDPREHALGATAAALLGYIAFHSGIGLLFLLSNLLRHGAGRISVRRSLDLRLTRLWLDYTALTAAIALGLVLALPLLVGMLGGRP